LTNIGSRLTTLESEKFNYWKGWCC
jgi:hypothetical protein